MSRPLALVSAIKRTFPGRFFFARLTRLPLLGGLADRLFFEHDDMVHVT